MSITKDQTYDVCMSPCSTKIYDHSADSIFESGSVSQDSLDLYDVQLAVEGPSKNEASAFEPEHQGVPQSQLQKVLCGSSHNKSSIDSEDAYTAFNVEAVQADTGFDDLRGEEVLELSNTDVSPSNNSQNSDFAIIYTSDLKCQSELLDDAKSVNSEDAVEPSQDFILKSEEEELRARQAKFGKIMGMLEVQPQNSLPNTKANKSWKCKVLLILNDQFCLGHVKSDSSYQIRPTRQPESAQNWQAVSHKFGCIF